MAPQTKEVSKARARTAGARRKRRSPEEIADRLLRAAGDEFTRCGFASATTAGIALKAGVTEAQLYRFFGSKADLFRQAIFEPLDRHLAKFNEQHLKELDEGEDIRQLTQLYVTELQRFLAQHSDMLLTLFVAQTHAPQATRGVSGIDALHTYFQRTAAMMTRMGRNKSPQVDPRLMVRISFGAVLANVMFKSWLFPSGWASDEEIDAAVVNFVIDGIRAASDAYTDPPARPSAPSS